MNKKIYFKNLIILFVHFCLFSFLNFYLAFQNVFQTLIECCLVFVWKISFASIATKNVDSCVIDAIDYTIGVAILECQNLKVICNIKSIFKICDEKSVLYLTKTAHVSLNCTSCTVWIIDAIRIS